MADALKLDGVKRQQFIDSAKRAKSDTDISEELQELRRKHELLMKDHEKLKSRILFKAKSKD